MKTRIFIACLLATVISSAAFAQSDQKSEGSASGGGLKNAVLLIIRHAEKPESGDELTPAGEERAKRYVNYFENYTVDSFPNKPDYLIAAADTKGSRRPRLTIEPLSQASGLKIDTRFNSDQVAELAAELRGSYHGKCIVISWRHGEIPHLIHELGGQASQVIPGSIWPGSVFNWVIQLRYDGNGKLADAKRVEENF